MTRHAAILTLHNLRVRRSTLIGWSIALALTMAAFVAMFPSIAKMNFAKIAEQYPEGLLKAFGVSSIENLATPDGFLNLELFSVILPLALIFLPIGIIVHAIAGNEESGYLGPLLALPIARRSVMAGACAAAILAQLLAIVVIVVSALATSLMVGAGLRFSDILQSSMSTLPLGALAAGLAALVCGATRRRGLATGVAGAVVIGMYMIEVLASFSSFVHDFRGTSVFHYYSDWLNHGITALPYAAILGIAALLMVVGGGLLARRDVT